MYSAKPRHCNTNNMSTSSPKQHSFQLGEGGVMRKVQSLDCVRLHELEFKGGWSRPSPPRNREHSNHYVQMEKASRFSRYTAGERALPTTPEKDTMLSYSKVEAENIGSSTTSSIHHRHLPRPNSVSSLTGLELPQTHDGTLSGPFGALLGNVRNGSIHYFVLFLLLVATTSDFTFRSSSKDSYYTYNEDLSGEVIYPNYTNRSGDAVDGSQSRLNKSHHNKKNKGLLGSAMIQSVTEALGPVLPFAGGVDLRRDENWKSWSSWLALWDVRFQKSPQQREVDQATAIPRGGGGGLNNKSNHSQDSNNKGHTFHTKLTLSTPDPFLSTEDISKMTLQEVALIFQYAIVSGNDNMDNAAFLKQVAVDADIGRMSKALKAIDEAVVQSRGYGVDQAITSHEQDVNDTGRLSIINGYGDVDALKFCAAMRILAEWRVLRQVPPGYKGYAVGMTLGHKDVVQNVAKIETAIHQWIKNKSIEDAERRIEHECKEEKCPDSTIQPRSPTLRQLLQYEVDTDIHPTNKLPRLKEKTAAMGLLWVRRQLHYQTAIFKNIISVPRTFSTVIGAVSAAYTEVYGQYHGWTVQKIFNYSFQSAPDADLIFRHMNPKRLKEVEEKGMTEVSNIVPKITELLVEDCLDTVEKESYDVTTPINTASQEEKQNEVGNPILNFLSNLGDGVNSFFIETGSQIQTIGDNINSEWDKTMCSVSKIFNNQNNCTNDSKTFNTRGGASSSKKSQIGNDSNKMSGEELEAFISKEMAADAREHILIYLNVAVPLLNDLAGLFDEMNMNDPTKV